MVARRRIRDTYERELSVAWHGAVFFAQAMNGKLPALTEVLAKVRHAPNMRAQRLWLSEHLGVPVRPISDAAKRALLRLRETHA